MEAHAKPLLERDLDPDPLGQFRRWFDEARPVVRMPEAAAVATTTSDGAPSARMVLVKGFDDRGFVFHTNYGSRKGDELEANPRAALLFYWDALGRQVRMEGPVARIEPRETAEYFRTRPRGAQIGAHASRQSRPIGSREELEAREAELARAFGDGEVPVPEWWGGYRLAPETYEFWQHRDDRLHDRFRYRREGDRWTVERLQP